MISYNFKYVLFHYFYIIMFLFFNSFITYLIISCILQYYNTVRYVNFIYLLNEWIIFSLIVIHNIYFEKPGEREEHFLSHTEERILLRFYELQLRDFCRRFTPSMPRATIATALHYFKRFYLRNSVMDYHPKEILVTCVYLACKVIIFLFLNNYFLNFYSLL